MVRTASPSESKSPDSSPFVGLSKEEMEKRLKRQEHLAGALIAVGVITVIVPILLSLLEVGYSGSFLVVAISISVAGFLASNRVLARRGRLESHYSKLYPFKLKPRHILKGVLMLGRGFGINVTDGD